MLDISRRQKQNLFNYVQVRTGERSTQAQKRPKWNLQRDMSSVPLPWGINNQSSVFYNGEGSNGIDNPVDDRLRQHAWAPAVALSQVTWAEERRDGLRSSTGRRIVTALNIAGSRRSCRLGCWSFPYRSGVHVFMSRNQVLEQVGCAALTDELAAAQIASHYAISFLEICPSWRFLGPTNFRFYRRQHCHCSPRQKIKSNCKFLTRTEQNRRPAATLTVSLQPKIIKLSGCYTFRLRWLVQWMRGVYDYKYTVQYPNGQKRAMIVRTYSFMHAYFDVHVQVRMTPVHDAMHGLHALTSWPLSHCTVIIVIDHNDYRFHP